MWRMLRLLILVLVCEHLFENDSIAEATLQDPCCQTNTACAGSGHENLVDASCDDREVIAIYSITLGTKKTSSGCPEYWSTSDSATCCEFNQEDCTFLFNSNENRAYHNTCNGKSSCLMMGVTRDNTAAECNTGTNIDEYSSLSNYMFIDYYCIEDKRIIDIENNQDISRVVNKTAYIWSKDYPKTITESNDTESACSIELDNCAANIEIFTLDINLFSDSNGTCGQFLKVFDSENNTVDEWTCSDNTVNIVSSLGPHYIILYFMNTFSGGDGRFWLGFQATLSSNITVDCPPKYPTACEEPDVLTTSTTPVTPTASDNIVTAMSSIQTEMITTLATISSSMTSITSELTTNSVTITPSSVLITTEFATTSAIVVSSMTSVTTEATTTSAYTTFSMTAETTSPTTTSFISSEIPTSLMVSSTLNSPVLTPTPASTSIASTVTSTIATSDMTLTVTKPTLTVVSTLTSASISKFSGSITPTATYMASISPTQLSKTMVQSITSLTVEESSSASTAYISTVTQVTENERQSVDWKLIVICVFGGIILLLVIVIIYWSIRKYVTSPRQELLKDQKTTESSSNTVKSNATLPMTEIISEVLPQKSSKSEEPILNQTEGDFIPSLPVGSPNVRCIDNSKKLYKRNTNIWKETVARNCEEKQSFMQSPRRSPENMSKSEVNLKRQISCNDTEINTKEQHENSKPISSKCHFLGKLISTAKFSLVDVKSKDDKLLDQVIATPMQQTAKSKHSKDTSNSAAPSYRRLGSGYGKRHHSPRENSKYIAESTTKSESSAHFKRPFKCKSKSARAASGPKTETEARSYSSPLQSSNPRLTSDNSITRKEQEDPYHKISDKDVKLKGRVSRRTSPKKKKLNKVRPTSLKLRHKKYPATYRDRSSRSSCSGGEMQTFLNFLFNESRHFGKSSICPSIKSQRHAHSFKKKRRKKSNRTFTPSNIKETLGELENAESNAARNDFAADNQA